MEKIISDLFSQYAYSPWLLHGGIWLFMILSAFGLPIPEEIILISAGFVGYMGMHPNLYPPPFEGAVGVNVYLLAVSAFCAVMASDYLIYFLGQHFGPRVFKMPWFSRLVSGEALERIQSWTRKYGYWAVIIFRFTPGVRFPGHLMCGAMGVSVWRFLMVDTIAAGLTVPVQVLLVCFYGNYILKYFKEFKYVLVAIVLIVIATVLIMKHLKKKKAARLPS